MTEDDGTRQEQGELTQQRQPELCPYVRLFPQLQGCLTRFKVILLIHPRPVNDQIPCDKSKARHCEKSLPHVHEPPRDSLVARNPDHALLIFRTESSERSQDVDVAGIGEPNVRQVCLAREPAQRPRVADIVRDREVVRDPRAVEGLRFLIGEHLGNKLPPLLLFSAL